MTIFMRLLFLLALSMQFSSSWAAYEMRVPLGNKNIQEDSGNSDSAFTLQFNTGLNGSQTVYLLPSGTVNIAIDWGDLDANNEGSCATTVTGEGIVHCTYNNPGVYTVKITGTMTEYGTTAPTSNYDTENLAAITSWGNVGITSLSHAFKGSPYLTSLPATLPVGLNNVQYLLEGANSFTGDISGWGLEKFADWSYLFSGNAGSLPDVTNLDTSNVTSLKGTFYKATNFNQAIGSWDVSKVTDFSWLFYLTQQFNQPLNDWDMSSATTLMSMFSFAKAYNQPVDKWNTSNVQSMYNLFNGTGAFNQPLNSWDVSNVTAFGSMFQGAEAFNQPINNWNTASAQSYDWMFYGSGAFNQSLANLNLSNLQSYGLDKFLFFNKVFKKSLACWNVVNFPSEPKDFNKFGTFPSEKKPIWGTNGSGGTCE